MEMNPPAPPSDDKILTPADLKPHEAFIDSEGTLLVPLSGDHWELIVDINGQITLACRIDPMDGSEHQRWLLTIGQVLEELESQEDLVEGINFLRSQGRSLNGPN